jgi:hypothetical protein
MGETAEWRLPEPAEAEEELDLSVIADGNVGEIDVHRASAETDALPETVGSGANDFDDFNVRTGEENRQPMTRIVVDDVELPEIMGAESDHRASPQPETGDWFSADGEVDWPAFARPRRERTKDRAPSEDRVRYLFPVPDATDWNVGELRYEPKAK